MRIALVLGSSTGGVGVHVRSLAGGLVDLGHHVRVVGPRATENLFGFRDVGAEFAELELANGAPDPRAVVALRRRTGEQDVLHAHGLRAGLVAGLSGRGPLVVTWHNAVLDPPGAHRRVLELGERLVAHRAAVSLGASADLVARIQSLGGRDVRLGPVAIAAPRASRPASAVRAELGLAAGQTLIVSVGRLHPQKAHDVLVRASQDWRAFDPVVVIAGDGPSRPELEALIREVDAPVRLLGQRPDVADLLAAADIVVLASRWEARSLAAQEALLLGRALVATDVGGMRDLVGEAAELVAPDDTDALAEAVRALLADPARREMLAARTGAQAARWPTVRDMLEQVEGIYRELVHPPIRRGGT
jgi:glycosyltransferase involved in cell wall biosynthesis